MKKKVLTFVLSICFIIPCIFILSACTITLKFNINFMVEGEIYQTIQTAGNETIAIPADPSKDGYRFDGWFWDDGTFKQIFTASSLLEQPLKTDMNVYAKFTSFEDINRVFNVTFMVNGEVYHTENVQNWHTVTKPSDPQIQDYNFLGWYTSESYLTEFDFNSLITSETTIYAKTQEIIDYDACDLISIAGFEKIEEYKFAITVSNATTEFNFNDKITTSKYATTVLSRDNQGLNQSSNLVSLLEGDNTLYLTVISPNYVHRKTYTLTIHRNSMITLNLNNGYGSNSSVTIEEGNEYEFEAITRTGYNFNSWSNGTDSFVVGDTITVTKSDTFIANWIAKTYTITFDSMGGNEIVPITIEYDQKLILPVPTKRGYSFSCWGYNGFNFANDKGEMVSVWNLDKDDVVLRAYWDIEVYHITYWGYWLRFPASVASTYTVKDKIKLPEDPTAYPYNGVTDVGYEFIEWRLKYSNTKITEIDGSTMLGDIDIEAKINLIEYTVTYDANGGTIEGDSVVKYTIISNTFTLETPTRLGYRFDGWKCVRSDGTIDSNTITKISNGTHGNYNLKAFWTIIDYQINYSNVLIDDANKGVELSTSYSQIKTYNVESDITFEDAVPKYTYFKFEGFYYNNEKITGITKGTTGNMNIQIRWSYKIYTITYLLNGGEFQEGLTYPTSYTYSSGAIFPNPVKEHYKFLGWKNSATNQYVSQLSQSYGNITLNAEWEGTKVTLFKNGVRSVKITYNHNYQGSTNKEVDLYYGQTLPEYCPTREGYLFAGWYTEAACKYVADLNGNINSQTVYANWVEDKYNYKYFANSSSNMVINKSMYYRYYLFPDCYGKITLEIVKNDSSQNLAGLTVKLYNTSWQEMAQTRTRINSYTDTITFNVVNRQVYVLEFVYQQTSSYPTEFTGNITYSRADDATIVGFGATISTSLYQIVEYGSYYYLNIPYQTGYTFKGWYTEPNGEGQQITNETGRSLEPSKLVENTDVYAYFEKNE